MVLVPESYHDVLMHYTAQGHRVIGLAYKSLNSLTYVKVQRARRSVSSHSLSCEIYLIFTEYLISPYDCIFVVHVHQSAVGVWHHVSGLFSVCLIANLFL